jgi:2-amino-4-hydroxy-6-hydroxymethyldihydropteridine diphosphokinase
MSDDLRRYVVGLGANLGDRLATLKSAIGGLGQQGAQIVAVSDVYESAAVGPPQPDYLNAAALLDSSLPPLGLLQVLLAVERAHGRERRVRWGPRTLDLDLLFSPGLVVSTPELTVPHPELTRRAFALRPLLDVAGDARDPASGELYADVLSRLPGQSLRRVETSAAWRPGRAE